VRRLLAALLAFAGCGGDADPEVKPTPIDPATAGSIRGNVRFKGEPPANPRLSIGGNPECSALHEKPPADEIVLVKEGRLQNVFVHVKTGLDHLTLSWPKEPVRVANARCVYTPRVSGAQVHQPIVFSSFDPTDHNVHGFTQKGQFNFTLRGHGTERTIKVRHPEVMIPVKCDLHSWMIGYIGVVPHPFFQVTGPDGSYELKGLPPGDYVLEAWHEKFGTKTGKVTLGARGAAEVDFTFP
jgi:hypothetical protein